MATSASITAKLSNGKWASIYLHHDGYISCAGVILVNYFKTQERVDALMALGDLADLRPNISCPENHNFEHPVPHYTVAYHRDRGEALKLHISTDPYMAWRNGVGNQKRNYVWNGEYWSASVPSVDINFQYGRLTVDHLDPSEIYTIPEEVLENA